MTYYRACGIDGAAVVVAGFEPGVVVAALKLEAGFEDLGGDVEEGGSEVGDETWLVLVADSPRVIGAALTSCQVCYLRRYSCIYHMTFAPLVCAEEDQGSWERSQHCWRNSSVQS